jgi:carbohydrate kinase (thermoresistant glucokinase family)
MGVTGSGKTAIGQRLAAELGWAFDDADDFHPPANVAKMSQGMPLTDEDRWPWLDAIRQHIHNCLQRGQQAVVTCSALKQVYRDRLLQDNDGARLVYLKGDYALIERRLKARRGHFMPPDLLASQFAALEEPRGVITVDIAQSLARCVACIRQELGLRVTRER